MILLPHLSAIRLDGEDAGDFLHNQVSADVLGLKDGETTFACYCEPKGRVLALMLIGHVRGTYTVILNASLAASIANRLKIYVMRSKVVVEVLQDHQLIGVGAGENADAVHDAMITLPVPGDERKIAIVKPVDGRDENQDHIHLWQSEDLSRGICWLEQQTSAQFLPQMLGFGEIGAINFRKGCYPGQEIVARTHYLGKLKRFPRLLKTSTPVETNLLDKILLHSGEASYEAVVADKVAVKKQGFYLFVVARMDPELEVDKIEIDGQFIRPEPLE